MSLGKETTADSFCRELSQRAFFKSILRTDEMPKPNMINAGSNTESFITGYKTRDVPSERYVKHLKVDDDQVFTAFYTCGHMMGQGNFATVYEVKDNKESKQWAMKIITKHSVSFNMMKAVEREIQILKMLYHPHIIELHEVLESTKKIYLILEKCECDLLTELRRCGKFTETDTKRVIRDLASAVSYLHKKDIVHRDIKLENILLARNPHDVNDKLFIKLTDFGLSIIKSGWTHTNMLHDRCGTLSYMAPEILVSQSYSQQCDVWAVGVIMYLLLRGQLPFVAKTDSDVVKMICNVAPVFDKMEISDECKDLITKVLDKNPASRTTATEILVHPWLHGKKLALATQSNNILEMMRMWNKDLRVSQNDTGEWPVAGPANNRPGVSRKDVKDDPKNRRHSVPVAVQNVEFEKQLSDKRKEKSKDRWERK